MRDVITRLYVFSVYNNWESTRINTLGHEDTLSTLKAEGLSPVDGQGKYKGKLEEFIALQGDHNLEKTVSKLARENKQESYLVVYSDRSVELVDLINDERKRVGTWTEASKEAAEKGDYSLINGVYYIIETK